MHKVIYYALGVLLITLSIIPIIVGTNGEIHTSVVLDPEEVKAYEVSFSLANELKKIFGNDYTLTLHFKTSAGIVIDVFLTNPKYVSDFQNLPRTVHYYKHAHSDSGSLQLRVPLDTPIAVVLVNSAVISTSVKLDVQTDIGSEIIISGVILLGLGIAAIVAGIFKSKKEKKEIMPLASPEIENQEVETEEQGEEEEPVEKTGPRIVKPVPVSTEPRRIQKENVKSIIKKLRILEYAMKNDLIRPEEYYEKRKELLRRL